LSYLQEYCEKVINGDITACDKVTKVCRMLLNHIATPSAYHFDEERATRPITFIEKFCNIPAGKIGQPMRLELFQKAIIQAAFGFVDDDGARQYNEVIVVMGRKNGKTSLLAAIMLYMLIADGEGAPQITTAAVAKEQAKLSYNSAVSMLKQSPLLSKHIKKRGFDIYNPANLGTIKALSSNENSLDGLDIHCAILDELAAWKSRGVYDLIRQAISARRQPQIWEITTNSFIRDGIFDTQIEYAAKVLNGEVSDDRLLPFIYELDGLAEINKPEAWIKANPALGTIKSLDYMQEIVTRARKDISLLPTVMVKEFCLKQTGCTSWLRWEDFDNESGNESFNPREFDYFIGGFDAADTIDLNAAVAVFARKNDPRIYVKSMYWLPAKALEPPKEGSARERDNMPYNLWAQRGFLRVVDAPRVPHSIFLEWFKELADTYEVIPLHFGYDPWHITAEETQEFKAIFGERCMHPIRQGAKTLSEPMKDLKIELQLNHVVYEGNPVLKMCFANTESKSDINGNIQPVKNADNRKRIDGTVALLCAMAVARDRMEELKNMNQREGYGLT